MKKLFIALLFLSIFPVFAGADPLPVNPFDKENKKIDAPVSARFRPFYYPQKDSNGAYILAEMTRYNEGTGYYTIDGNLYMTFADFFLHISSAQMLPKNE